MTATDRTVVPGVDALASSTRLQVRRILGAVALADVVVVGLAILLAGWLRVLDWWGFWGPLDPSTTRFPFAGAWILLTWLVWLVLRGAYSPRVFAAGVEEFKLVALASVLTAGTVGMTCYLLNNELSRAFVVLIFLIGTPLLLIERYAIRKVVHRVRINGRLLHRVVAVGGPSAVGELVEVLHRERYLGYEIVGACIPEGIPVAEDDFPVALLGTPSTARAACEEIGADTVLVAGGGLSSAADLRRIAWDLEGSDIALVVAPSLTDIAGPRVHLRPVAGLPLMHIEPPQADEAGRWGKQLFDVAGSSLALLVLLPLILFVAVLIKLEDGGPVFFRQTRVGRGGGTFQMYKFRSMVAGAEENRDRLRHLDEGNGVLFKLKDDPRTTRVGRVLRRYSLDELPQLYNVLKGDMSLVGPRPPLAEEVAVYGKAVERRLLVRPGMTGLWQVSGRSRLSWTESVRLDLYYVDNWSMIGDLVILAKTLRAVLGSKGAY